MKNYIEQISHSTDEWPKHGHDVSVSLTVKRDKGTLKELPLIIVHLTNVHACGTTRLLSKTSWWCKRGRGTNPEI